MPGSDYHARPYKFNLQTVDHHGYYMYCEHVFIILRMSVVRSGGHFIAMIIELRNAISMTHVTRQMHIYCFINLLLNVSDQTRRPSH